MKHDGISCPKCGSPDLFEIAWNRRRCNHCGTESVLSGDRTRLELIGWQCLKCGFNNESETTYCGKCGAALVKPCPKCFSEMREDLEFCRKCGLNYINGRQALFQQVRQSLKRGLTPERGMEYLGLVLKFNRDDYEALLLRGEIYIHDRQWRNALALWTKCYRTAPEDPAVLRVLDGFIGQHIGLLKTPGLVDGRLEDDKTKRYLRTVRENSTLVPPEHPNVAPFMAPRAPGKISMGLLRGVWPAKARRVEEMHEAHVRRSAERYEKQREAKEEAYQAKLNQYQAESTRREKAHSEVFGDRLALAAMCVEALEERDERDRVAAEAAAKEQARRDERESKRLAKKQKGKRPAERSAGQTHLTGGVPGRQMDEIPSPAMSGWMQVERRKELLSQQVQQAVARGARVESQSDHMAVVVSGKKVNHALHFVLGLFTAGLWWIVWFLLLITGGEKRKMITVDENGNVQSKKA